jgi:AraC-like DNA-binding protein
MRGNFKYLTHNTDDSNWGLFLMVAGSARIEPDTDYPPKGHPPGYNFNWNQGRILREFQVNYITEGEGVLETRKGTYEIKAGSILILHPDEWHRYRPVKTKGWFENYVGFMGETAERAIKSSPLLMNTDVIDIGFHENILNDFNEIIKESMNERPGYQQVCCGLVMHILGQITSIKRNEDFSHTRIEESIRKACIIIRDKLNININIEELAKNLDVDYSLFRKAFKKYTGLSPMQYHTALRMKQAMNLLINTDFSVKEISSMLGFCSLYYFSKLFKEKESTTPSGFRKRYQNKP